MGFRLLCGDAWHRPRRSRLPIERASGAGVRGILQVAVHDDHSVAARMVDPRADGDLMPKVTRQMQRRQPRIARRQPSKQQVRAIGATVVDQQHLPCVLRRFGDNAIQTSRQFRQRIALIIKRNHNGNAFRARRSGARASVTGGVVSSWQRVYALRHTTNARVTQRGFRTPGSLADKKHGTFLEASARTTT